MLQVSRGDFYAWQRRETSILTQVEEALIWLLGIVALRRQRDVLTAPVDPYESPTIAVKATSIGRVSTKRS